MTRQTYKIFSPGRLGNLTLPNRLVRSATWDPSLLNGRSMTDAVLDVYCQVAAGGVGLIITGDFPVVPPGSLEVEAKGTDCSYSDARIEGVERLVEVVHRTAPDCKILAQLAAGYPGVGPSAITSPFWHEPTRPLSVEQIHRVVDCFVQAIAHMQAQGFDGVQLHAAHGALLSAFLSPYTNRREDEYGGSVQNRVRIVAEIVAGARHQVGDWPILIKMNGTDYVAGGVDGDIFAQQAAAVAEAGLDAIEISGGMWDCLARPEAELGFSRVPAPESHTRIHRPEKQSYFLPYAERLNLDIPIILVGGNRDVERLEQILKEGHADFIALCRPLISEPDLPNRWLEGRGKATTDCISCNACIHDLIMHPGRAQPGVVRCVFKADKAQYKTAQAWLAAWVEDNLVRPSS